MTLHISNEEMARYLNLAYNSESFNKIISGAKSEGTATLYFQRLGNALSKYYISTGDNTIEGINSVCNLFIQSYANKTFDDKFMELIISRCAVEKGIECKPTIGEKASIFSLVAIRNANNPFYTHCFPGALYETVSQNGLDISNELFKEELQLLETYFKTGFKIGKLCYCELSDASLSYATQNVPERVKFALGSNILFTKETKYESFLFSLKNNLIQLLQVGRLRKDDFNTVYTAGKKLIDFYCKSDQSAIALFRKDAPVDVSHLNCWFRSFVIDSSIKNTWFANKLQEILKRCQDEPNNMIRILDEGLKELEFVSPEFRQVAEEILNNELIFQMKNIAVKNFMHGGFADGYEVESGKMLPSEFAITLCPCPIDMWNKNRVIANEEQVTSSLEKPTQAKLVDFYKKISTIDRILSQASKEEVSPDKVECISLGKTFIPIYLSTTALVFPSNYLISADNGEYTISLFTERVLTNKYIYALRDSLTSNPDKLKGIVERYKNTNEYDPDYEDDLESEAALWYAKVIFDSYSEEVKKKVIKETAMLGNFIKVKEAEQGYMIEYDNERVLVSADVLVDTKTNAPYNNLYSKILEAAKNKSI